MLDAAGSLAVVGAGAGDFGLLGATRGEEAAGDFALAGGGGVATGRVAVVVVLGDTVVVVTADGAEVVVVGDGVDVVEAPAELSGGGVSSTSDGTEVSVGSDVTADPGVADSDATVGSEVVVASTTTGTGSQVSGEDVSAGSGSPGGSVAAGFCSTTL